MFQKASIFFIAVGFFLVSCSKDPISDLSTEESLVYITNHDKAANFKQYKTFSIVDSVLVVENDRAGTTLDNVDRAVLTRIISNMESLGYKLVAPSAKPDVGINVAWITNTYLNVASQPYYGGFWGGYGYGYGYGVPNYYTYYETAESYWLVSMVDFKNPNTVDKTYNVLWNSQIRGSGIGDERYAETMIDAIFGQSAYLKIN